MAKLKCLANQNDGFVTTHPAISDAEISQRNQDYHLLTPKKFAYNNNYMLYKPAIIQFNERTYNIQHNFCTEPYCKWFGKEQYKYKRLPNNPSRYKLSGDPARDEQSIVCNNVPDDAIEGISLGCKSKALSNWSIAEEINRLATINQIKDWDPNYQFHKEGCLYEEITPFKNMNQFYKRGKSSGGSQKWQCKECKKITNVLPKREEIFSYHQQRNDILPQFAKLLLNRTPVKRTCEILKIGSNTYYHKLEWLYRRTLEFLERYETKPLQNKEFPSLWLNTDTLHYYLNNVRKKGKGGKRYDLQEEKKLQTYIVITGDLESRYIFRSDVAYDSNITLEQINRETIQYKIGSFKPFYTQKSSLWQILYLSAITK